MGLFDFLGRQNSTGLTNAQAFGTLAGALSGNDDIARFSLGNAAHTQDNFRAQQQQDRQRREQERLQREQQQAARQQRDGLIQALGIDPKMGAFLRLEDLQKAAATDALGADDTGANNVQSTFRGGNGNMWIVERGGGTRDLGVPFDKSQQIINTPAGIMAIDPRNPQPNMLVSPEQIGRGSATTTSFESAGAAADTAALELPAMQENTSEVRMSIKRLQEGGDLRKGFQEAYGFRRPFATPGSPRQDASSLVSQIVEKQTLEAISAFKGVISDRDVIIARSAATRLGDRNISDKEADKALADLDRIFANAERRQAKLAQQSPIAQQTAPVPEAQQQALPPGVTEQDIQHTMQKYGVSREEVLQRLGGG